MLGKRFNFVLVLLLALAAASILMSETALSALRPQNTPPTAAFSVDPPAGVVGTEFYFDPSATHDAEDTLPWLLVRFDYDGDGTYDTLWLNPTNPDPRHIYTTMGTYTVRMEVKDRGGLRDTAEHSVVVGDPGSNTRPTAHCTVTPAVGNLNTTFTFSAAGSTDAQDAASALIGRWDWDNTGEWDSAWHPATQPQTLQYSRPGLKTARLEVRDTGTLSDKTTCSFEVKPDQPNTAPTAVFSISPTTGTASQRYTFDATASHDAEDGITWLVAQYDFDNDGVFDTLELNASQTYDFRVKSWGQVTVRMQIKDPSGLTDETTRTITVIPEVLYLPRVNR